MFLEKEENNEDGHIIYIDKLDLPATTPKEDKTNIKKLYHKLIFSKNDIT